MDAPVVACVHGERDLSSIPRPNGVDAVDAQLGGGAPGQIVEQEGQVRTCLLNHESGLIGREIETASAPNLGYR